MSRNEITVAASPERVFAVLTDASTYADWVVGAQAVRGADDGWPQVGSRLYHRQGVGPATLEDETEVLESRPPERLVLLARLAALGAMRVELELAATPDGGTQVVMRESPEEGAVAVARNPVGDAALTARNAFSLRRLKELAEAR